MTAALTRVPDDLLTLPQAAQRLGIGRSTALRLARQGRMPGAFRIGGRWRVSVPRLEAYMHGDSLPGHPAPDSSDGQGGRRGEVRDTKKEEPVDHQS